MEPSGHPHLVVWTAAAAMWSHVGTHDLSLAPLTLLGSEVRFQASKRALYFTGFLDLVKVLVSSLPSLLTDCEISVSPEGLWTCAKGGCSQARGGACLGWVVAAPEMSQLGAARTKIHCVKRPSWWQAGP